MAWRNFKINDCLLITTENSLNKLGKTYILEPRITKLLSFMAQNQGIVFTRDELIDEVWDGAVVSDQVVTQSIFELRKILKKLDEDHWIITIPKRGYKLDADVQQIYIDPNTGFKLEEFHSSNEHTNDNNNLGTTFPAGPMTRAFSKPEKDISPASVSNKIKNLKLNHWLFDVGILSMLVLTLVFASWANNDNASTKSLKNPRQINIEITSSSNQVYSIAKMIESTLFTYTDYTSSLHPNSEAGKTLSLYISDNNQLHIELYNNISHHSDLKKSLLLQSKKLYTSLNQLLNELIQTLTHDHQIAVTNVPVITESTLLYKYLSLPDLINDDGQVNKSYLTDINKLISDSPNNSYLLAKRYISYAIILTLDNKETSMPKLMNYAHDLVKNISQQNSLSSLPTQTLNALALNQLYQGNFDLSQHYLSLSRQQSKQNSALYYILQGKIFDIKNQHQQANENFSIAKYLSPSYETEILCQSLVFHSI
ncbi:hypothetical protein C0W44_00170 [Photobacterium leiognathi subsp. mandapamensis]|nr:hypothetical protein C0W44_00170 [Photobacterium leiognathi subsp. mandapamensis]